MTAPEAEVYSLEPYRAMRESENPLSGAACLEDQRTLRLAAIEADASAEGEISLALLWRQLAGGMYDVVDGFFSESRCYLVLVLRIGEPMSPTLARRTEILGAVLGGVRQKNVAIDRDVAESTVAMSAKLALSSLGVDCNASRAHPLLISAARAVVESALVFARSSLFLGRAQREFRVIGLARPEHCLSGVLTAAELLVARGLVEGLTHKEISWRRRSSPRTVANQVGSIFRRLGISGRNELIQRLVFDPPARGPNPMSRTLAPPAHLESVEREHSSGALRSA